MRAHIASALPEAQLFYMSPLPAVQIYLAILQVYVWLAVYECFGACVSLAEFWASLSEQMVLQQVIMTQDKLLN